MPDVKWTIQPKKGSAIFPKLEFNTKREAVQSMNADRALKTSVVRGQAPVGGRGRDYTYTKKD